MIMLRVVPDPLVFPAPGTWARRSLLAVLKTDLKTQADIYRQQRQMSLLTIDSIGKI
jgi:hypothetical protein